jgi:IS5 family transposase
VAKLLRLYFLQQWFKRSDPPAEDALYDSESRRRSRAWSWVADETKMLRFRPAAGAARADPRDLGGEIQGLLEERRPTALRPLSERWRMINPGRAPGASCFRMVKQLWGFAKVRYRGFAKNLARAQTMFALANLYQVRRQLLVSGARCVW